MKLSKLKKICSEFGNDTNCSLSFNCYTSTSEVVEEFPYVYAINADLKNINIGFTKNPEDTDILDDDFEPGVLTLAKLSHIIEPFSNDFNVIFNAANETNGSLDIENINIGFSFSKEFLNYYLFGVLDDNKNIFLVGEINKDRFGDMSNTILVLRKVYYKNTLANNKYDYGSETLDISIEQVDDYEPAILQYTVSFNSTEELNTPVYDNIQIMRNSDNKDIFIPIINLLFEHNDGEDYKFLHHSIDSVIDYVKTINVIQEKTDEDDNTDADVIDTILYIDTPETIKIDIDNYLQQAKIDLLTLENRLSFSDISTNILDGGIHKNFYTDIVENESYYAETQEEFKSHINKTVTSIKNTIKLINTTSGGLMTVFNSKTDELIKDNFNAMYTVSGSARTIEQICKDSALTELKHDSSVYYLFENINYIVSYDKDLRNSKMSFTMLNTDDLTNKLKLGNNIIYEYANNTANDPSGKKLSFSTKNISSKISKFTHYFYDDMDLGVIILDTNTDLPLVSTHLAKGNPLFGDYGDVLKEIHIPNCITSLGSGLFSSCAELTSLELPKYLTSIGEDVFPNSNGITFGYAKNNINSRSWLNNQFNGTYNYYAPNFNGYNTLLFYPTTETPETVDISTTDFDDIDIIAIGKQSIPIASDNSLTLTLDSTTEYIDDDAFKTTSTQPINGTLTIDASNSPLWYVNIPSHNSKFANIDLQLNTLSPVCLHYEPGANHTYTYTNEIFAKVQQNALATITNNIFPDSDVTSLVKTSTGSISIEKDIILEDIHLTPGCKILNNEIRFIVRDNLTNDNISLTFTLVDDEPLPYYYTAEYKFNSTVKINTSTSGINLNNFAEYILDEDTVKVRFASKSPKTESLTNILGADTANTLKIIYIQLNDNGDFKLDSFSYYGESNSGGVTLDAPANVYYRVMTIGNKYELLGAFIKTSSANIKTFKLSNNAVDYEDFTNTLSFMNDKGGSIKSNLINYSSLQYRTKPDSTLLDNINIFPLFYTLSSTYIQSANMFLKTVRYLYSIQLSGMQSLAQIGISKLILNDNFNPVFIEFPESINRFYDCPIIIDKTYNKDELTIRFWSNFEDIITKKTLLDINAIQNQIRSYSVQYSTQSNLTVSTPGAGSLTYSPNVENNSTGTVFSPTGSSVGQTSIPTNTLRFTQNNEVLCICTNSDSLEKLIYINSENLKTLRIQVKDGEEYEHIYNFFKTNINKLVHINTSNNHTLNIVVETFVHTNDVESEIATYNFYDI